MRTFDGKVVLVTGAASGIGRALAVTLAARGSLLALSDVAEGRLAETAGLARVAGARDVHTARLDVADRAGVAAYADQVSDRFGRVNVVISNAGVSLTGDLVDLRYEDMDWVVATNFWGVVHTTRELLPHLIASGDGHVVTISSLFGLVSAPGQSLYNATKYAVRGFTESLREEMLVAGHPVGVTTVHPGGIRTGIVRHGRGASPEQQGAHAAWFEQRLARTEPERAAQVILRGVLRGSPRVLVGADARLVHHAARLVGARYQDVFAWVSRRTGPALVDGQDGADPGVSQAVVDGAAVGGGAGAAVGGGLDAVGGGAGAGGVDIG